MIALLTYSFECTIGSGLTVFLDILVSVPEVRVALRGWYK